MRNETQILILLDRSSSMRLILEETVVSMNHYIDVLRTQLGECSVWLEQFDMWHAGLYIKTSYDAGLKEVPRLTTAIYKPRGTRPLYDALGKAIIQLDHQIAPLPEEERPNHVIVIIITDGLDNASRRYHAEDAARMVLNHQEKYQWHFVYLGANQDAIVEAAKIHIPPDSALSFENTNIKQALNAAANYSNTYRAIGQAAFTVHNRVEAVQELTTSRTWV